MRSGEKAKKKGAGLTSVFKLIQDLTDFEGNIQDCIDAQEMAENKSKIESFLSDIDKMYDVLLGMAREGISAIRRQRQQPDMIEDVEDNVEEEVIEEQGVAEDPRLISLDELKNLKPKPMKIQKGLIEYGVDVEMMSTF